MTIQRSFVPAAVVFATALALLSVSMDPAAQTLGEPERFSASAVDSNTGWTGRVEITVNRWSTPGEREVLVSTLIKEGSKDLLEKLRDMKAVGRIYTAGSVGYELRFSDQQKLPDGGRSIVLAADRPMSFRELVNQTRSTDFPFTWVQLNMRADGTGEGTLAVAARVFADRPNRPIEVENFALQPIRLLSITSSRKK
ncbi:MAG TPA: hypothetical protein VJM31_09480 [Vicinamibacterales bacterium]|nr:hypothetical protein [Vicinamibacterales bacterium]